MKQFNLILIGILNSLSLFAQKDNISGTYFNSTYMKIEIKDDQFYFIFPQDDNSLFYLNDTLAMCTFNWVDDDFIELNSIPPYKIAQKDLKVTQSLDSTIKDSVKIHFSIPYQVSDLNIKILTKGNGMKIFNLDYSIKNNELMLPSNINSLFFMISPKEYTSSHGGSGLYYGTLYYAPPVEHYIIEKNINRIDIEIPAIKDDFFEKYYVKGEYAKVSKDTITWKGDVFVKKKK
jgi:hypothetical protein